MANNLPDPVYFKVRLHYNGTFIRHPCSYAEGETYLFTDLDFAAMNLHACGTWLERFTGSPCEKLFYCIPGKPLSTGSGLEEWFDEDMNLVVSDEGEDEVVDKDDEVVDKDDKIDDKEPDVEEDFPNFHDLDDMIGPGDIPKMNKTCDDDFLSKMCVLRIPMKAKQMFLRMELNIAFSMRIYIRGFNVSC
ncbi:hypothetical protein L2E82_17465 [Cichorium intybus]|uniref:Uncharacterized protein n=1 Tax=Cichorium intybus TaxID=13427 RepID=A0ACB9F7Y7_CICIN|nr:hypothetical protein L2E82_17465 [Cichorium intybus]